MFFAGAWRTRFALGRRWWLPTAVVAAGLMVTGLVAAGSGQATGMPKWWGPPPAVRAMLAAISPANLQADDSAVVGFGTRHTASSQTDPVRGIGAAGNWIYNQLVQAARKTGGNMTVAKQSFVQPVSGTIPVPTEITNVVATLRGTDATSNAVYVVSAHYDDRVTDVLDFTSDAPGADRDGSGVAAMLELAHVMAAHPAKSTIVFVAFDGEEQGLYGSAFFAQQEAAAGANVVGDLNMDMIGSANSVAQGPSLAHTVSVYSEGIPTNATANQIAFLQAVGGEDDGISRQLARYILETGQNDATQMDVQLVFRRDRILKGGDQISFDRQGYPAVRFTEPNENYNHEAVNAQVQNGVQMGDLLQFVDFKYLARVTRVVGSSLAALANSPQAPTGAVLHITPPVGFQGSSDSSLSWNANPESDVVGYEVVWRDTTDTTWTHSTNVGNVTSFTLTGINKNTTQFGVRALDGQGDRSPVSYAVPSS
jgi:hypothetical protein